MGSPEPVVITRLVPSTVEVGDAGEPLLDPGRVADPRPHLGGRSGDPDLAADAAAGRSGHRAERKLLTVALSLLRVDGVRADDIPVANTPPGGWTGAMPPPVLAGCTEPLVAGAPDLRGHVAGGVRRARRPPESRATWSASSSAATGS